MVNNKINTLSSERKQVERWKYVYVINKIIYILYWKQEGVMAKSYSMFVSCFLVYFIVNSRTLSDDTQRGREARWRHTIQYIRYQNIQDIIIKLTYSHSTLIDVSRYRSFIEQNYSCSIRYFDRPDSFRKPVTWPTKIYDDILAFLFNKCNLYNCVGVEDH